MPRLLHILVCAASAAYIAMLAVIVTLRVWYPYELEWLEGLMLDSVRQILDGRSLYGPPSIEFVSSVYNPVYVYVAAAFIWPMGVGFAALRLVSVLSTFGILAMLVFRLKPSARTAGLVAAGLYAASYRFSGAWMDVARNDSLFLAILLGAFLIGRDSKSRWQDIVCGIGFVLAFFTKQTTLAVLAVVFAGQLLVDWRRYWMQWLTFGLVSGAAFLALDWSSDGWYSYYTLDSPLHFVPHPDRFYFLAFARLKLLPGLLATAVFIGALVVRQWWPSLIGEGETPERVDAGLWSTNIFAIALVVSSWAVFRQRGTFDNVFMPACLGLAMGAGIAYEEFRRGINPRVERSGPKRDWHLVGFGAVALLILQQFTVFAYNPLLHVPGAADRAAGDQFMSRLRAMPGTVLVWAHGYFGELAGKGRHAHDMAFIDAAGLQSVPSRTEENRRRRQQVFDTVFGAVQRQDFDWIVIDRASDLWAPYYLQAETILEAPRELTGRDTRVGMVLTRNPIVRGGRLDPADPRWNFLFGAGWGPPGPAGRLVIGDEATIDVGLEAGHQYQLQVGLQIPCAVAVGKITVFVWWNGKVIAQKTAAECGMDQIITTLAADSIEPTPNTLRLSAVREGAEEGQSDGKAPQAAIALTNLNVVASPRAR
jgi:hypothetical protein